MAEFTRTYAPLTVRGEVRATQVREVMPGSPSYSASITQGKASRDYWMKWDAGGDNIPQAFRDFLGYSDKCTVGQKIGNKFFVRRVIPYEFRRWDDYLFADSIQEVKGDVPVGHPSRDAFGAAMYDEAKLQVLFSSRNFNILTDTQLMLTAGSTFPDESTLLRYVDVDINPASRSERIPSYAALKWVDAAPGVAAGQPMANIGSFDLIEADVTISWYQIPLSMVPWDAINDCAGKTNATALGTRTDDQDCRFAAETLICQNPKFSKPYRMTNFKLARDVEYHFKRKNFGVNYFYRYQTGKYELATRDGTAGGEKLYKTANFDQLFWGTTQPFSPP